LIKSIVNKGEIVANTDTNTCKKKWIRSIRNRKFQGGTHGSRI